jgi:hypothetical protein
LPYVGRREENLRTIINIGKLKKVHKYSNQLNRGKISDYNGEKEGPQIFPYVGRREEIMRTRNKIGQLKKKSAKFPKSSKRKGNFADQEQNRKIEEKVRKISHS